jgi:hypothetical protein
MVVIAHIFGIPAEETALSLAPVATILVGVAVAYVRGAGRREPPSERPEATRRTPGGSPQS